MTPLMVALLCGFLGFMMEPSMLFEDGVVKGLLFILFMFVWPSSLYYILVFPRNYNCMTFVRKEMSYRELKKEIEETYFQEPISLEYGHFLISDKWIVLGTNLNNPICILKSRIDKVIVTYGDMQKGINPIESNGIIISLTLNNGKKTQTGYLKYSDVEMAEYTLEKEFPGKYVNALGELVLEDDEVED